MLYIMRHGKTDWNEMNKLQGKTDIPLNDEGRKMALNAYKTYKDLNIDICYSSPLKRAFETAEIVIGDRDIELVVDNRLSEMGFGEYEGSSYSFDRECSPIDVLFNEPENYIQSIGGSETFEELFNRTGEFLKEVIEPALKDGKDVLIVGHGAMNASIICQVKNLPVSQFWKAGLKQCEIMKL